MRQLIRDYKSVFTRAYRMDVENFYRLHRMIKDQLTQMFFNQRRDTSSGYFIPTAIRLSIALRFFAGGSIIYLIITLNVFISSVYGSVWAVVDCVNYCNLLSFSFPSLEDQHHICEGYKNRSFIKLQNIIGAIDGILVWLKKPSLKCVTN